MTSVDSTLKQILQKCFTHPSISISPCLLTSPSLPRSTTDITLPDAPSLQPALLTAGANPRISLAMDQAYQKGAADLRARGLWAIAHLRSNQYSSKFHYTSEQKIISVFTESYLRQLVTWREEGVALYLRHFTADNGTQFSLNAPKFNHEYVPLLEHFFAENPFPTHADKVFLAKKSAMTYRQIHVWFQNRRNRMKKEGQTLKKKPMAEGASLPLDTLYQRMEKFIIPEGREVHIPQNSSHLNSSADGHEVSLVAENRLNPLEFPVPSHAFPTPYPHSCSYDPFPARNGVTNFGAPEWHRRSVNTLVRHLPLDIDNLIGQFSQMNILDSSSSPLRSKGDSFAAVAAITVIPPSAPHPALVRGVVTNIAAMCGSLPSIPATVSRRHVFDAPSPQSSPVTLVSSSETPITQKTRCRKVAPLPRRTPHGNPMSCQDIIPVIPKAPVISSFSLSSSRSSSFGSDSSSRSRLFSSVSPSSSSSSSIVTPPSSTPSRPARLPSPSASLLSLPSSMVDLFGDVLQSTSSPTEGLEFDFNLRRTSRLQRSPTINFSFNAPPSANLVRTAS